jgi:hypothetical protein
MPRAGRRYFTRDGWSASGVGLDVSALASSLRRDMLIDLWCAGEQPASAGPVELIEIDTLQQRVRHTLGEE